MSSKMPSNSYAFSPQPGDGSVPGSVHSSTAFDPGTGMSALSLSSTPLAKYQKLWDLLWPKDSNIPVQSASSLFYMKRLSTPAVLSYTNFSESIIPSAEILGHPKETEAYFMDLKRLQGYLGKANEVALPCRAEQMVVTEDYVRLLYRLTQLDRSRAGKAGLNLHSRRGAVVIGNAGIGKSFFLSYLLVVRLRHAKPTVFYDGSHYYYLFSNDGVAKVHVGSDHDHALPDDTWVLCDNAAPWKEAIWNRNSFFVQVTGPNENNYNEWKMQYNAKSYWMDGWSWPEIVALSALNPKAEIKLYWQAAFAFGFIPRFVERIAYSSAEFSKEFKEHYREVAAEIGTITKGGSQFMLEQLLMRGGASRTLSVRPRASESFSLLNKRQLKDRPSPNYYLLTPYIRAVLASILHEQYKGSPLVTMSKFLDNDATKSAFSLIFESYCHLLFEMPPEVSDQIMSGCTLTSMETNLEHMVPILSEALFANHYSKSPTRRFDTIVFRSLRELGEHLRQDHSWKLREDRLFVYFKPEVRLLSAIDGIMLVREGHKVYTVFFQATLGSLRPIKANTLADIWAEVPVAARKNGGFVIYLTPSEPQWQAFGTGDTVGGIQSFIGDDGTWARIMHQMKLSVPFEKLFTKGSGMASLTSVGPGDYFDEMFGSDSEDRADGASEDTA